MNDLSKAIGTWCTSTHAESGTYEVPSQDVSKSVEDFAGLAVFDRGGDMYAPAQWTLDRRKFIQEFRTAVYVAVGAIARKVAQQDAKCYFKKTNKSGSASELVPLREDHPLEVLFSEVNPIHTQYDLWYMTVAWRLIVGDTYWLKIRNGFNVPAELWPLPPSWVWAIPSPTEFISRYLVKSYFARDVEIPAKDIVHLREANLNWDHTGRFYGSPPLKAADIYVDLMNTLLQRLNADTKNFSPPGLVLESEKKYDEPQLTQLYMNILNQHRLANQSGMPMILHDKLKLADGRFHKREIDYTGSLEILFELILAIFGVPKPVVGMIENANRANMGAALEAFCENTVNPLLTSMGQSLTQGLGREFDPRIVVAFDPCTADDADKFRKDIETANRSNAITPNEVREKLLGLGPYKVGGDRPLVQATLAEGPLGNAKIEEPVEPEEEQEEERSDPLAPNESTEAEEEETAEAESTEKTEAEEIFLMKDGRLEINKNRLKAYLGNGQHK